jgi:hypothetical protein
MSPFVLNPSIPTHTARAHLGIVIPYTS